MDKKIQNSNFPLKRCGRKWLLSFFKKKKKRLNQFFFSRSALNISPTNESWRRRENTKALPLFFFLRYLNQRTRRSIEDTGARQASCNDTLFFFSLFFHLNSALRVLFKSRSFRIEQLYSDDNNNGTHKKKKKN